MKLLFFDIDGTLVSFKSHAIPQSTVAALRHTKQLGNKVIIATGRPTAIINNLGQLQQAGLIDGYVTMNGAYCYVGDKVLYKSPIPQSDIQTIAAKSQQWGIPCIFVNEHTMHVAGNNNLSHEIFAVHLNAPGIPESDYMQPTTQEVFQITPFFNEEQESIVKPLTPDCEYGRWHPAFVDITAKGNTKAHGIDVMADFYGVPLSQTVAFGDGGNDIPMLTHAGIGVAMGNSIDLVKANADFVTSSVDDDGIHNALSQLQLM